MPDAVSFTADSPPRRHGPRLSLRVIFTLIVLSLGGIAVVWFCLIRAGRESLPPGVSARERELARRTFHQRQGRQPDRFDLLHVLAESYSTAGRLTDAVDCLGQIPTSHPLYGRMARYQQGRTLLALHRAADAERQARELIDLEEAAPELKPELLINLRQGLRHILEVELRFEERQALLKGVVERREATGFEIFAACFQSHLPWNGSQALQWIEEFHAADPQDPHIRIALGRYLTGRGKLLEARHMLEQVSRERPRDLQAAAALIACLREADAAEEVDRLTAALPPQSPQDPWLLLHQRGLHALENGQGKEAAAAYEQILQVDRTSNQAWQGLARASLLLDDAPRRSHALKMATGLGRILSKLAKGIDLPSDPNSFLEVADVCAEIGLDKEGWILTRFARQLDPRNPRALDAAKNRLHFFEQYLVTERLGNVIVRTHLVPDHLIVLFGTRGNHDDRNIARSLARTQFAADRQAVERR